MILGVVGAGTMGAGIAQLGCAAGYRTLLHDPLPEALDAGERRVRDGLGALGGQGPRRPGRRPGCSKPARVAGRTSPTATW